MSKYRTLKGIEMYIPREGREKPLDEIYGPDRHPPDRWGFAEHKRAMDLEEAARRPFRAFPRRTPKPSQSSA